MQDMMNNMQNDPEGGFCWMCLGMGVIGILVLVVLVLLIMRLTKKN